MLSIDDSLKQVSTKSALSSSPKLSTRTINEWWSDEYDYIVVCWQVGIGTVLLVFGVFGPYAIETCSCILSFSLFICIFYMNGEKSSLCICFHTVCRCLGAPKRHHEAISCQFWLWCYFIGRHKFCKVIDNDLVHDHKVFVLVLENVWY